MAAKPTAALQTLDRAWSSGAYHWMPYAPETMQLALRRAVRQLKAAPDFDSFACTGISGAVFTGALAAMLRKPFAVLRKDDDTGTHSVRRNEGYIGARVVLVDDFVAEGHTLRRLRQFVEREGGEAVGAYLNQGHAGGYAHTTATTVMRSVWILYGYKEGESREDFRASAIVAYRPDRSVRQLSTSAI